MSKLGTEFFKLSAVAMVVVAGAWAAPAGAVTAGFYNDASTQDTLRFTLGCGSATGDCAGQLEALSSDSPTAYDENGIFGDLFTLPNQSLATETAFVNANTLGGDFFTTGTKASGGGASSTSFFTDAEYILLKIGKDPDIGLIRNLSGGMLELFFEQEGKGAGLSHITAFGGTAAVVPLPASLLLLLAGIGGLGALGWKRRPAVA